MRSRVSQCACVQVVLESTAEGEGRGEEDAKVTALEGDWEDAEPVEGLMGVRRQDFVGELRVGSVLDVDVEVEVEFVVSRTVSVHFKVWLAADWLWFSLSALEANEEVESLMYPGGEGWLAGVFCWGWTLLLLREDGPRGCAACVGPLDGEPKRPKDGCFTGDDA